MKPIHLFESELSETPIVELSGDYSKNQIYMKRDDMIPFSFGGNKARKAAEFYKEIYSTDVDVVMTYGSNSSNHCRIIANMAKAMGLACHIISPEENREILYNTKLVEAFGATIETCPVTKVAETIDHRIKAYEAEGKHPYFIVGGGHGNPGTHSYVKCYQELRRQEKALGIEFDYIFHASGTGATQAGLVCGELIERKQFCNKSSALEQTDSIEILQVDSQSEQVESVHSAIKQPQIVGISIARVADRGREVVKDSIKEYMQVYAPMDFETLYKEECLEFTDAYRQGGYGESTPQIVETIKKVMDQDGIPMDTTYVGKAFHGMLEYLKEKQIENKKILFIHTGGTPLFFDKL